MSNFSNIGFDIKSKNELSEFSKKIYEIGEKVEVEYGMYIFYPDSSGAEIWLQLNDRNSLIGLNPHYNGTSKRLVCLTESIDRSDSFLDGAFHCWANPKEKQNPNSGEYPFVFDLPNAKTIGKIKFPFDVEIQLSAFAQEISLFDSEEEFYSKQSTEPKFASQSFLPISLFKSEGEVNNPPEAICLFSGIIKDFDLKINSLTKNHFYWFLVDTLGGEIDVVADQALIINKPKLSGILEGQFWLSGKINIQPNTGKSDKGFFKKLSN